MTLMPTLDRHTAQPQVRSLAESAGSISLLHTTGTTEIAGLMAKGQPRRKCTCVCMSVKGPPGPYGIPPHHREAQRLSHSARGYRVCQPGSSKRSREFEAVAGRKPSWFSAVFVLPQLRLSLHRRDSGSPSRQLHAEAAGGSRRTRPGKGRSGCEGVAFQLSPARGAGAEFIRIPVILEKI